MPGELEGPWHGLEAGVVTSYILVQLLGGVAAAVCAMTIFGQAAPLTVSVGYSAWVGGLERKNKVEKGQYFALAIGFCVIAGAYGAGAISGGAFNPAVALALDVTRALDKLGFIFIFFELLGAMLAALAFAAVRPTDVGGSESTGKVREQLSSALAPERCPEHRMLPERHDLCPGGTLVKPPAGWGELHLAYGSAAKSRATTVPIDQGELTGPEGWYAN
eukprot:Skav221684  [mRNA]  locus=scaffold1494:151942:160030:+ [translate_table: standard]